MQDTTRPALRPVLGYEIATLYPGDVWDVRELPGTTKTEAIRRANARLDADPAALGAIVAAVLSYFELSTVAILGDPRESCRAAA